MHFTSNSNYSSHSQTSKLVFIFFFSVTKTWIPHLWSFYYFSSSCSCTFCWILIWHNTSGKLSLAYSRLFPCYSNCIYLLLHISYHSTTDFMAHLKANKLTSSASSFSSTFLLMLHLWDFSPVSATSPKMLLFGPFYAICVLHGEGHWEAGMCVLIFKYMLKFLLKQSQH